MSSPRRGSSSPPPSRSPPSRSPPATPVPARRSGVLHSPPAGSPLASPGAGSAGSASPVFARTPRSVGSPQDDASPGQSQSPPSQSPAATPRGHSSLADAFTPTGRPGGGARSPGSGNRRSPGSSPLPRSSPSSSHRGFLGSAPAHSQRTDPGFEEEGSYIYGTNINDLQVSTEFHRFINGFKEAAASAADLPYYHKQLMKIWEHRPSREQGIKFPISGNHLFASSPKLYEQLIHFPTEVIPIFDRELWVISVKVLRADPETLPPCQVKVFSLEDKDSRIMRLMNPSKDIERLVSLKGIVIRCSDLVPDMQSGLFCCSDCKHEVKVPLSHWTIDEPTRCESCGKRQTFQIMHNECSFGDRQLLKVQETPELVPEGETPQNVVVYCYDDLVDQVRPGDRVEVTGIYRASAVRPIANWSKTSAIYRTHVDAIAIAAEKKGRIEAATDDRELSADKPMPRLSEKLDLDPETNTDEDISFNKKVRELAAEIGADGKCTIVAKLVGSFAPSIYEEDEVKKGLLCQLFGGTPKAVSQTSRGRCRPEINTLLCGDPSTAKSQLMLYANKIAPRAVLTSGKGSSAVGLTASINRDPVTKDLVLESGALVLADRGMCCIDEFDKMDENARAILHEAMEQQTVSIAKGGIVCSLNARTSILACANPESSTYDPKKSVVDNINLPKNLMTRFDLIWLMLDKRNRDMDRQLGEHLVSMYSVSGAKRRETPPIDAELFRRYLSFARRYVFPRLTAEASEALITGYTDLRNQGSSRDVHTATPRTLESLIRLSESLAKMELREEVTGDDVAEAIRLLKAATYTAAVDPETGLIDMEQLIAGVGAGRRRRHKELESLLEEVLAEKGGSGEGLSVDATKGMMNEKLGSRKEQLVTESEFNQALRRLEDEGRCRRRGKMIQLRG